MDCIRAIVGVPHSCDVGHHVVETRLFARTGPLALAKVAQSIRQAYLKVHITSLECTWLFYQAENSLRACRMS